MYTLEGKVAMVTGGTSGLGRAICIQLAKSHAKVVVAGRREVEGLETVRKVEEAGSEGFFVSTDVSKEREVQRLLEVSIQKYGKLDIAVNNAGVIGQNKLIHQYTEQDFDDLMNINVKGVWNSLKFEIIEMLKQKSGCILNISSVSGLIGFPYNSLYSASKHAIHGFTKSAALEFGHKGIRINAICPGGIETDMLDTIFEGTGKPTETRENMIRLHALRRLSKPEEIAKTVCWLCSEDASFIHGSILPVDGGWTAH